MSTVKFDQPLYKVFEPGFHPQRPVIIDESIESPETISLIHEEAAAQANGGDPRGGSPPGLLPMAAYKQPSQLHGFPDGSYSQYSAQPFAEQPTENAGSQMNSLAFAANSAANPYMAAPSHSSVSVISLAPSTGSAGSEVQLKISSQSSQYDIMNMSTPAPYVWVYFGSQKCHTSVTKAMAAPEEYSYIVSTEAPQFVHTNCRSSADVPLTVLIEGANGEELARNDNAGSFTYDTVSTASGAGVGTVGEVSAHEDITRGSPQSPEQHDSPPQLTVRTSATNSPNQATHALPCDSNTNTYGYPPSVNAAAEAAAAQAEQHNFAAAAAANFNQESNMLGTYHRSSSFTDHYPRAAPPALRTPTTGWPAYHSLHHDRFGSARSPAGLSHAHAAISRPSLTPSLPAPIGVAPELKRTSMIQSGGPGSAHSLSTHNVYSPWAAYPTKAVLNIVGSLDSMSVDWTPEEWNNKRRIVMFRKKQSGGQLEMTFRPVPVSERPSNSICVSCIYWAEKNECFITSVDTIHLLEQLLCAPDRFTVEEKNRIRRNLEGFKPLTVSKAKADSEEFFKVIMGFGNPKPRNIEKDVKVFPWKILGQALKKIISKYSATPSSTRPTATPTHLLTPVSGSYHHALPPTPGSTTTATDATTATGYLSLTSQSSDAISSPRSLTGPSSWAAYPAPTSRALSPGLKSHSPQPSSLRIPTLPAVYDNTRSTYSASLSSPYGLPGPTHHLSSAIPVTQSHGGHNTRWDSYDVTDGTGAYPNHHTHSQVYGSGYGDGSRA